VPGPAGAPAGPQPAKDVFLFQEKRSVVGTPRASLVTRALALAGQSDEAQTRAGPELITTRTPFAPISKAQVWAAVETTVTSNAGRAPGP